MTKDAEIFEQVIRLCDIGFATYDRGFYAVIDHKLSEATQTEAVQKMRRLAAGGPTLVSPRFAYPHIADAAHTALSPRGTLT